MDNRPRSAEYVRAREKQFAMWTLRPKGAATAEAIGLNQRASALIHPWLALSLRRSYACDLRSVGLSGIGGL